MWPSDIRNLKVYIHTLFMMMNHNLPSYVHILIVPFIFFLFTSTKRERTAQNIAESTMAKLVFFLVLKNKICETIIEVNVKF